jgi:lysophospholipase L1-like esterase
MMRLVLILVGLVLAYLILSGLYYFSQSKRLFLLSEGFSRDYAVGPGGAPMVYLALGDSTVVGSGLDDPTQGFVYAIAQKLSEAGARVEVHNHGMAGAKLHDLVTQQLPLLETEQPELVSLSIGANDATHFTSLDRYKADLLALKQVIQSHPETRFLVATAPDMGLTPALPQPLRWLSGQRVVRQNELLARTLSGLKNVYLVDLYASKLDHPDLYAEDRFHPSKAGYQKWSAEFTAKL